MWPQRGMLLVSAQETFVALNWTSQMEKSVVRKGNVEGTTGPWTSNVSFSAYLGKWIIRFHCRPGTWVPHVLEELCCWCLHSASSCNYILHLLRMSRLDYESWEKKKWLQLSVALKPVRSPWWDPPPGVCRSKSPEGATISAWEMKIKREQGDLIWKPQEKKVLSNISDGSPKEYFQRAPGEGF